jgi:hypothetical protein
MTSASSSAAPAGSRSSAGCSFRLHPDPVTAATVVVETDARRSRSAVGSQPVPSAVDILHPGRVAVLFEGGRRGRSGRRHLRARRRADGGSGRVALLQAGLGASFARVTCGRSSIERRPPSSSSAGIAYLLRRRRGNTEPARRLRSGCASASTRQGCPHDDSARRARSLTSDCVHRGFAADGPIPALERGDDSPRRTSRWSALDGMISLNLNVVNHFDLCLAAWRA